LDTKGIEFTASMRVINPNSYPIKITATNADLYLEGRQAGKAQLLKRVTIPSNSSGLIDAQIRTDFNEGSMSLLPLVLGAAVKKKVNLRVKGKVRAKSFLIGRNFDFDYTHDAKF
jgi:LEA14-like dessication related protein